MKLIKINSDHYIVVDDSKIKESDWHLKNDKLITRSHIIDETCKKITHSTQPLGKPMLFTNAFESDLAITTMGLHDTVIENWGCKKLSLSEVKELIGEKSWKGYIDGTEWEVEIVDGKLKLKQ